MTAKQGSLKWVQLSNIPQGVHTFVGGLLGSSFINPSGSIGLSLMGFRSVSNPASFWERRRLGLLLPKQYRSHSWLLVQRNTLKPVLSVPFLSPLFCHSVGYPLISFCPISFTSFTWRHLPDTLFSSFNNFGCPKR